ncbi:hypothetical protein ACFXK0_02315 [Nocardia sp. NPDC059177]|uniref:hypothetical protein n=1 Tax=Nocardia sp. NPDC059177 TaxID=3346759 RepID=UPI0036B01A7C
MSTHRHTRARRHQGRALTLRHGDDLRKLRASVPTTRCHHGKRRYFTQLDAELVLRSLDRRDPRRQECRAYVCPACHGWHLTSQSLRQYRDAHTVTRAPITLGDIPPRTGPMPTPADLARLRTPVQPAGPAPSRFATLRSRFTATAFGSRLTTWLSRR